MQSCMSIQNKNVASILKNMKDYQEASCGNLKTKSQKQNIMIQTNYTQQQKN